MENLEKELKQIFEKRKFQLREYQMRNILNYLSPKKPHVCAIGTGGGKTILSAARFELYYMCGIIKPNEKVVIIPADKTILRGNFKGQFDKFKPTSFTYSVVVDKLQLVEAIENNVQVIIALPQLLKDHAKLLKNVKWLVVDEAHKWYFAPTIKGIIKDCKPKHQFLLTGTPFKFNRYKNDFIIDYTSVSTLYKLGFADDVNMQVLHTSLSLTRLDWSSMTGNLRDDKKFTKKEIHKNLSEMILKLVKKVKLPIKDLSSVHNITNNMASKLFGKLQKTIIFTHRTDAANVVAEYLRLHGVNCIVSHSNIDGEIAEESFDEFRKDDNIKVMVSVNRGKEGFDFPELYNIIDMTYSQNFEVVMQMIGRLLRPSKKKTYKVFYKVAPNNTAGYFTDWMDCLIQLFDDKWYQDFNGRNMLDVTVPNALLNRPKEEKQPTYIQDGKNKIEIVSGTSLTKGTKIQIMKDGKKTPLKDGTYKIPQTPTTENPKPSPIEIEVKNGVITKTPVRTTRGRFRPKVLNDMGFDLSLSFMDKNDWFRLEDPLSTVATTSLRKIMNKFDGKKMFEPLVYSDEIKKEYIKTIFSLDENGNRKYNIISDLQKSRGEGLRIYNFFEKFELLHELQTLLPSPRKSKGYWTIKENILAEALKVDKNGERVYKESIQFRHGCSGAWKNAYKLGILYTECKFPYIDQATRLDRSVRIKWTDETALEKARTYKNISEVYRKDSTLKKYLKENDLVDLVFEDGRKSKFNHTKEKIIKFINEHKIDTLREFNKKYYTTFNTIKRNLPEIKLWDDIKYKATV